MVRKRMSWGGGVSYAALILAGLVMVFPVLMIVLTSFKPLSEVYRTGQVGLDPVPQRWVLSNYSAVFSQFGSVLGRWFLNSAIYGTVYAGIGTATASIGAYAIYRYRFRGSSAVIWAVIATLMMPVQVTYIPLYNLFRGVKMINSYGGLLLPGIASAFAFYLVYQFMLSLPRETIEAAVLDGAGEARILVQIVLPLLRSGLSAVSIILFITAWNDYFWPLIITSKSSLYTLVVGLATVQGTGASWTDPGEVMALASLVIGPVIVLYLILQRSIMEGIASAGLK